jgi:hypothetical protein
MRKIFIYIIVVITVLFITIILFNYVNPLIGWIFPFAIYITYIYIKKRNNDISLPIDIDEEE